MVTDNKNQKPYKPEIEKISRKQYILRTFIIFIGNTLGLSLISYLNWGETVDSFTTALFVVLIVSIVNSIIWPTLIRVFMPFLVYTFGVGVLILDGLVLYISELFIDGFSIGGFGLILTPIAMAAITTILSTLFTINNNSSYYRAVTRDALKRRKNPIKNYPGVIIVEIDGLAHDVLKDSIQKGYMPTVERWIKEGNHTLREWETDLSSQTGASQAGILHGNNTNITAFRWIEKEHENKMVQCSGFSDVKMIEQRISNGNGLLAENGASRSNLFSGDTDNVIFTFSKISNIQKLYNKAWYSVFSNPYNFARIVALFAGEMILEIYSQIKHSVKDIQPRIHRDLKYIPTRAGSNIFMREINTMTLIGDMMIGDIDIAYSTYLGYDEIAHHSGIRDEDAWYSLRGMDKQIARLEEANKYSEREYQLVIQSDHGQCNGATFTQRYGKPFEEFVRSLLPEDMTMYSNMNSNGDHLQSVFVPFKKIRSLEEKYKNNIDYIQKYSAKTHTTKKPEDSELIVLASGNLGMIYLTQWNKRLTYEKMISMFPDLIPGIVNNEYVGFILVKSEKNGPMVIGSEGIYYLDTNKIEGKNPLEDFGKHAADHIRRSNSFKYTPDILVNSFYDKQTGEVCAFEELVGSHGGMGGTQTKPFILHPSDWNVPKEEIIGAENIYKILKSNANELKNKS